MAGERTVVRIYLDKDDKVSAEWICSNLQQDKLLELLGMVRVVDHRISSMIGVEDMGEEEIDDIHNLLDGE